ncbi:helix-turn-helix domain-containing protein [Parageobacillus thermoglucosidasius]|nr:helix-turn-helix domain-containing protein [Parageobacillus thermoglucosidasius]MED4984789.1 helix-turn-helix domain-containing protein [Parageobacillus thermoglucosidasius]
MGKEVASMVNVCRQTVSHYVSLFNEGGLEILLHRDFAPGREPFLTEEQQEEIKQLVLTTTPVELGWDVASAWNTKLLQSDVEKHFGVWHFPRSVTKTPAPQRAVVDTAGLHIGERRSGSTKEF